MPNPFTPFGFRPVIRAGGSPFSINEYGKPASDPNALFAFDLVTKVAAAIPLPENPTYTLPAVQTGYQGTPGTSLWLGSSLSFGAASTASVHPVTDEPDVIFIAQAGTGTPITNAAHAGKNANVQLTSTGNLLTKMSGMQINSGSIQVSAALDVKILRVAMIVPNAEGMNAIVEVSINKHALGLQTAGV